MQIAGKNHRQRLWEGLGAVDGELLAILVPVVDAAEGKQHGNDPQQPRHRIAVSREPAFGDEPEKDAQIGKQKSNEQVQVGNHPGMADFVERRDGGNGSFAAEAHTGEGRRHP